ncbi:MAG: hypothetical protein ACTSPB_00760 [Candidatus Thorarchaeota archaeon]
MTKKGSGWFGDHRRHVLAGKGVSTVLPDGRRLDVSKYVANGYYGDWMTFGNLHDFLMDELDIVGTDEFGIIISNGSEKTHLDIYSMRVRDGEYVVDWEGSPEVKTSDVKDVFSIFFDDWIDKFNEFMEE